LRLELVWRLYNYFIIDYFKNSKVLFKVIYPEVLATMPVGPLFSILFFLMLFTLGIDSEFGCVETFIKSLTDHFKIPDKYRTLILACYCTIMFLIGIAFCCPVNFTLEILKYIII
jgi:SNF family Na+-dependent transporter